MAKKIKIFAGTLDRFLYRLSALVFSDPERRRSGHQFISFAIIGVVNTAIDFALYVVLTRSVALFSYQASGKFVANALSFIAATAFSFYCNRAWTFRKRGRPSADEAVKFFSTTATGLVFNSVAFFMFASIFGINDLLAKVFATVFSMIWNFILTRSWVFRSERSREPYSYEIA